MPHIKHVRVYKVYGLRVYKVYGLRVYKVYGLRVYKVYRLLACVSVEFLFACLV